MANKYMKDGVYVIEGITSTEQLEKFYKEVVEENIEKYVGITTQGRKFSFIPIPGTNRGKAVELKPDEEYAINPTYRDLTIKPIEEVVVETPVEEVKVPIVEEAPVEVTEEDKTEAEVKEHIAEVVEEVADTKKDVEIEQLKLLNETLKDELAIAKERADVSERDLTALVNQKIELETLIAAKDDTIVNLQTQVAELQAAAENEDEIAVEPLTVDSLIDAFDELGYTVYITRK